MTRNDFTRRALLAGGGAILWSPVAGHEGHPHPAHPWTMPHVPSPSQHAGALSVSQIEARIAVTGQLATTELILSFHNPGTRGMEGRALLPVPPSAVLKSFGMEGGGKELAAELLPRGEARRIYDEIVRRLKDPAILEFAGLGAVKTGVFPVPAGKTVRVRLVYEELLPADGDRVDYLLPRTQAIRAEAPPWKISLSWQEKAGIRTLYSPSHPLVTTRTSGKRVSFTLEGRINPGPLRVSILKRRSPRAVASFLSYPASDDEGYFLMLLSPPEAPAEEAGKPTLKREVTLVLDRSGSMAGSKLKQVRAAARQVLGGLEDGERFNLITCNEAVERFAAEPVALNAGLRGQAHQFLDRLRVSGGTNLAGALQAALAQGTRQGFLPMVLFLTDGLPTIGETSESKIREIASNQNRHQRRLFTFGVGVDVNTPLLARLADDSRAVPTFVLPGEDVEVKVAGVFRRLSGPVLESPQLTVAGAPGRLSDVLPSRLPDFFAGDQVVVTGRYLGAEPLELILRGNDGGGEKRERFLFRPTRKRDHDFVPRIWATRRIAVLSEALRDLGADASMQGLTGNAPSVRDPRVRELVDEIVRLSTEHGILTEYTAFLAREGEVFSSREQQNETAAANYVGRALQARSGKAGVNQDLNLNRWKNAGTADKFNRWVNADLQEEEVTRVQQIGQKTFYARGRDWIDAGAVTASEAEVTLVDIGSPKFFEFVDRLVALNQQSALALGPTTRLVIDGTHYQLR